MKNPKPSRAQNKKTRRLTAAARMMSPERDMPAWALYVGTLFRAAASFVGTYALVLFLCDAMDIIHPTASRDFYVSRGFAALFCLIFTVAATAASVNRIGKVCGAGILLLTVGITAISSGNIVRFAAEAVFRFVNYCLDTLISLGYTMLSDHRLPDAYHYDPDTLLSASVAMLALIISAVFYFFLIKRVRLIPIAILVAAFVTPVFTYNISQSNTGFALLICFIIAVLALWAYDYRYCGRYDRRLERQVKKAEKRSLKCTAKKARRSEKRAVKNEAASVYAAAINADLGYAKAKAARRAYYKNLRRDEKSARAASKKARRAERKACREEKKKARLIHAQAMKIVRMKPGASPTPDKFLTETVTEAERIRADRDEKRSAKKDKSQRDFRIRAAGGFAGAAALVLALIAVWLPASLAKTRFPDIPSVSNAVTTARAYYTAYLLGDSVDLNGEGLYAEDSVLFPHTLSFDERVYSSKRMFITETSQNTPVYLRSWIGTTFDASTDTWTSPDSEAVADFRTEFGKKFSSDTVKYNFNKYVFPSSVSVTDYDVYHNFSLFGFSTEQVNVYRMTGESMLIFTPSVMNTDLGFLKRGSIESIGKKYSFFYDGVYTSRLFGLDPGYSTVSFVPVMNRGNVGSAYSRSVDYYTLSLEYIDRYDAGESLDTLTAELENELGTKYDGQIVYSDSLLLTRYAEMSNSEKKALHDAVALEKKYRDYADTTYTATCSSAAVSELADTIVPGDVDTSDPAHIHDTVMSVVDYLCDTGTYTLTPTAPSESAYSSTLEQFLFETHEGYCTHFATAATAILREYGIPARYCEGYIAPDFYKCYGATAKSAYRCDVYDSDAHAWIEVYYPNMGWVQYEVTPEYHDLVYSSGEAGTSQSGDDVDKGVLVTKLPEDSDARFPHIDTDVPVELTSYEKTMRLLLVLLIILTVFATASLIVRFIRRRALRAMEKRFEYIDMARSENMYADKSVDKTELAKNMNDAIFTIFNAIGCAPEKGELMSDYAIRMKREYGDLSRVDVVSVMNSFQKAEFAHGLTLGELSEEADYLSDIISSVYGGLTLPQKIRLRYFRRII